MELEKAINIVLDGTKNIIEMLEKKRTEWYDDYYNDSNDFTADIKYADIEEISSQILALEKAYITIQDSQYFID